MLRAVLGGDVAGVRQRWSDLTAALAEQPLLYVALARGGNPLRIVASRGLQAMLRRLLGYLPRLGLLTETVHLIETIQEMELSHPVGPGQVTEFDRMFKIGCKAMVRRWCPPRKAGGCPRRPTPAAAAKPSWSASSNRPSKPCSAAGWSTAVACASPSWKPSPKRAAGAELKQFIQRYGHNLFTQRFMMLGNLRAILHQGVNAYLQALLDEPDADEPLRLVAELGGPLRREDAVRHLTVALEAVAENYAEYVDYNSTTTQSDRGEMLFTLLDYLRLRTSYDLVPPGSCSRWCWPTRSWCEGDATRRPRAARGGRPADGRDRRGAPGAVRPPEPQVRHVVPSIAERLEERFLRPLQVDQLRAWCYRQSRNCGWRPAPGRWRNRRPAPVGPPSVPPPSAACRRESPSLPTKSRGPVSNMPAWLEALQQEVDRAQSQAPEDEDFPGPELPVPTVRLSREEVRRQVRGIAAADRGLSQSKETSDILQEPTLRGRVRNFHRGY